MTTIKELERLLNVSRVSLYAILKKDAYQGHIFRGKKNMTLVDEKGVEMLKAYYANNRKIKPLSAATHADIQAELYNMDFDVNGNGGIIAVGILQQQLAKKDEQIDSLLNIVSNQHQAVAQRVNA